LEFKIVDDGLLIRPIKNPREGWKKQFDKVAERQELSAVDQEWLDAPLSCDEGWKW